MDLSKVVSKGDLERQLLSMTDEKGLSETLRYYVENHPEQALSGKNVLSMERALKRHLSLKRNSGKAVEESIQTPFKLDDFKPIRAITKWIKQEFQPTLIMVGPAGCGKTQFAKALSILFGWRMLILNHREGLKNLSEVHNAVFWDDVSMEEIDNDTLLAMLETNERKIIRVLHSTVEKPAGLIQIMAFNRGAFMSLISRLERREYSRRCIIAVVPSNFIQNNVQIVNNINIVNHTNIYNNSETIKENQEAIWKLRRSND